MGGLASIDLYKECETNQIEIPTHDLYENEFEKELCMAVNLFRKKPKLLKDFIGDLSKLKYFDKDGDLIDKV